MEEELRNQKNEEKRLRQFIDKQYSHMEDYCQNQIRLQNCLATNHSSNIAGAPPMFDAADGPAEIIIIIQAIQNVQIALTRVRNDYQWLQDYIQEIINITKTTKNHRDTKKKTNDNIMTDIIMTETTIALLQKHLQVTKRVIQTVQDKYHSNGIPMVAVTGNNNNNDMMPTNSQEIKTIALATLRASSANLIEGAFEI